MLRQILSHITHMYDTYNKVSDKYTEPTIHCKFGLWRNDPCLPVWRRGPYIRLIKYKYIASFPLMKNNLGYEINKKYCCGNKAYYVQNSLSIKTGTRQFTVGNKTYDTDVYETSAHKLPGNLKPSELVWDRNIRKKLRKFGFGWIKPYIQLPIWCSFHIFNHDVYSKTKYDEERFEFPPQFTIVAFGLSFSIWLKAPKASTDSYGPFDDMYWESIFDCLYKYNGNIEETIENDSMLSYSDDKHIYRYFGCRPEYLRNPNLFYEHKSRYGAKHMELKNTWNAKFDFIENR